MLTYWIKPVDGGWELTLAGAQVMGPMDEETMIQAACDMARNQVGPMTSARVMQKMPDGAEHPVAAYGPNAKAGRPRPV